jgi:outer membrane protein insertion porin family
LNPLISMKSGLKRMIKKYFLALVLFCVAQQALAVSVVDIKIRGNSKVESEAILTLLEIKKGSQFDPKKVSDDIRNLFDLGYFSDIRIFQNSTPGGIELVIQVVEKPVVVAIEYVGFEEVGADDFKEKLEVKLFTIVNEAGIARDLRLIEQQYSEKGFFLASASYELKEKAANEVILKYLISEGAKVQIGDVEILGNEYFSDDDLIEKLMTRPLTRSSALSSMGAIYNKDFIERDLEFLSYYYRDFGFARVNVGKPIVELDQDRKFARVTFQVEEGMQYRISELDVQGDILIPKTELIENMKLQKGELFKFSRFRVDIEMLVDRYGDLGYAFADVDPRTSFDDKNKTVAITYVLTKGEKVFIGKIDVVGNTKTRDNVIRREIEVSDTELYSGTKLRQSKSNINRLGFFEEVQAIKQRDPDQENILNYEFKVKEKSTGQLQAAMGFQPYKEQTGAGWFGQGRYTEDNQSGYGWKTGFSGRWDGKDTYDLSLDFTNPRVNDTKWSFGSSLFYKNQVVNLAQNLKAFDLRKGFSSTLGKSLFEQVRGTVTYRLAKVEQTSLQYLPAKFREDGLSSSLILGLRRNRTNNYIDPSDGSDMSLSQTFSGGLLGGDHVYSETSFNASWYLPLELGESFRTYFRLHNNTSFIYPLGDGPVPLFQRYRLGGPKDLRAYKPRSLGPYISILRSPGGVATSYNNGGNKKTLFQLEYFAPLIPEAGIKGLLFFDAGKVFDDNEEFELSSMSKDVGFGIRWMTPMAPFRFEWAYPYENGELGEQEFILYLGF